MIISIKWAGMIYTHGIRNTSSHELEGRARKLPKQSASYCLRLCWASRLFSLILHFFFFSHFLFSSLIHFYISFCCLSFISLQPVLC